MKYFVEFVVSALVQHAEEVDVRESEGPEGISYRTDEHRDIFPTASYLYVRENVAD